MIFKTLSCGTVALYGPSFFFFLRTIVVRKKKKKIERTLKGYGSAATKH